LLKCQHLGFGFVISDHVYLTSNISLSAKNCRNQAMLVQNVGNPCFWDTVYVQNRPPGDY